MVYKANTFRLASVNELAVVHELLANHRNGRGWVRTSDLSR